MNDMTGKTFVFKTRGITQSAAFREAVFQENNKAFLIELRGIVEELKTAVSSPCPQCEESKWERVAK